MKMKNARRGFTLLEHLIVLLLFFTIPAIPLSFWTDNQLDFWVTYSKGAPTNVSWGWSYLASLPWPLTLFLDLISQIARLFV